MVTTKDAAIDRVRNKYAEFARKREFVERSADEAQRDHMHYANMIRTEGWKLMFPKVQKVIHQLQSELAETSSFRVFKCMDIRSEIKSLKNLYKSMGQAEKLGLLFIIKE